MSVSVGQALVPDALEANRGGTLTPGQRTLVGRQERAWWKNELLGVLAFGVIGVLILTSSGGNYPAVERLAVGLGFLAIAAFFLVRSIPGTNALARDERAGKVEAVEGPFGKHSSSGVAGRGGQHSWYYLDIGEQHFEVSYATYQAAPDHGMMRLYVLPGSHKVVNFERLPDAPLPEGALDAPAQAVSAIAADLRSRDQATRLQAMATMEAMKDATVGPAAPPPADQRDARPLAEAIVGTWHLGPMAWTFAPDGTATGAMPNGRTEQGRWSVDGDGKLRMSGLGGEEDAEAWVAGDILTVSLRGRAMNLQRAAAG
jgi:hypothetical protein